MAEYIDREKVLKTIDYEVSGYYLEEICITDLLDKINEIPIADVVPRSEVERLTKELLDKDVETENEVHRLEAYIEQIEKEAEDWESVAVNRERNIKDLQAQVNRLKAYDEERDIQLHQRLVREAKQEVARELIDDIADFIWQSRGESFCLLVDGTFYGREEMKEYLRKKYIGE